MVISHEPEKLMESVSALYRLKEDLKIKKGYGISTNYLRGDTGKYMISSQVQSLHSTYYLTLISQGGSPDYLDKPEQGKLAAFQQGYLYPISYR